MKKIILILLLFPLWGTQGFGQSKTKTISGLPPNYEIFDDYIIKGKQFVEEGNYVEAMKYYVGAKKMCVEFDIPKVDTLLSQIAKKIEAEQNALRKAKEQAEKALAKATEMQKKNGNCHI